MKIRRVSIGAIILSGFVLWFGTYAYLYFYPITGLKPLYSYFLFLGFAALRLLMVRRMSILGSRDAQEVLIWTAAFIFYTSVMFFFSSQSETAEQTLISWFESAFLLIGFTLLFAERRSLNDIQIVFAVIAVFGVAVNFYDFFQPTFSKVPGRAAGFYENPNIAGKFIAFSMVAAIPVIPRKLRIGFVVLCGLGILATFSRNAWLLWGIGVVFLGWMGEFASARYRMVALFLAGLIGAGAMTLLFTGSMGQMVEGSPLGAHLDANTMARLGIGGSQVQFGDASARSREKVAIAALEEGARKPLFGNGLAYTREPGGWKYQVSTHNMYLLFWAEGGFFGLVLYLWFVVLLWRHSTGVGRVLALQIMIASLFTHNQLEQPTALMFAALVIAHGQLSRRKRSAMPQIRRAATIA